MRLAKSSSRYQLMQLAPSERVLEKRVAAALNRVRLGIAYDARAALEDLGVPQAVVEAATEEFEQAKLRCWLAEDAEREAERRMEAVKARGAWPFDAMRWSAWLKLSFEGELGFCVDGMVDSKAANTWFESERKEIEPAKLEEAKRCFKRVMHGLFGISPFDPARFERSCMEAAEQAAVGCGQSDVLWSRRVTSALGGMLEQLAARDLSAGKQIAKRQGWMYADEEVSLDALVEEAGLCSHGIEPNCCSAGCGDL